MNFFGDISTQVRELFESMTPGARLTAALLLGVVVVSLGFLFQQSTSGPDDYLFGAEPLTGSQVNAMTAAMSQAGLNNFEVEGSRIRVPRSERHAYIAAVADAGALPGDAKDFMSKALDGGSVFDSREVKHQRIKLALEKELSHVISWFPWVDRAAVTYDVKTVRGPRGKEVASATVAVMPTPGESLDSGRARNIQKLVAGGFTSMKPDDVSVNDVSGDSFGGVGGGVNPEDFETLYHRERVRIENEVRSEIKKHLNHIAGVSVQVNAVLNEVRERIIQEEKPDSQAVATMEQTDDTAITETTRDNADRPGLTINGPTGVRGDDAPRRENTRDTKTTKSITQNRVGQTKTQTLYEGMAAKEIHASVEIPRDYVIEVWKRQQAEQTGQAPETVDFEALKFTETEVRTAVENAVKPLLPTQVTKDEYQQVNVVFIDTVPGEALPAPSIASTAWSWTSRNGSTLMMVGVAAFSLLMLRSVVRGAPEADPDAAAGPIMRVGPDGEVTASVGGSGDEEGEDENARPKLKLKKVDTLKDDLSDIVRDDPDAAAAIIRTWIGNAS